jgi:hypothetical protein
MTAGLRAETDRDPVQVCAVVTGGVQTRASPVGAKGGVTPVQHANEVLDAMAAHTYFVFLPKSFDSCPRTLLEAELAGCEIVTNLSAGRRDPGDIREVLLAQPGKFWGWL